MSLIRIFANNIELDFVKETLTIKTENNILSKDFKVSSSSYPFLIIENKNTKLALGTRDISSVKKQKIIDVIVFEAGNKYFGKLQVLSFLNGFRKCNLKYSSEILTIMDKKISEFMPVVSVIPGETDPVPYAEETDDIIEGSENWADYPISFLDKNFPEVKWQFPTMNWLNKFGVALESSDDWFVFQNKINNYDLDGLILNTFQRTSTELIIQNKNVVSPQVYLLSPLFYALQNIGFSAVGDFIENAFIKRLLLFSAKDNLVVKNYSKLLFPPLYLESGRYICNFYFYINIPGTYNIKFRFEETMFTGSDTVHNFNIFYGGALIYSYSFTKDTPSQVFEGNVEFDVIDDSAVNALIFSYFTHQNVMPVYSMNISNGDRKYYDMHPTIQLARYVPDWTFGTYLNELQNLFNLEIIPDDYTKTLKLNFNEDTIVNSPKHVIKKSLNVTSYDLQPYNAFLLKYDNEEDSALWITTEVVEDYVIQKSDFSEEIRSKFKYIPVSDTADLSDNVDSKDGIGLMIYDPVNKPNISPDFLEQTLKMNGNKGIYEVFFKKFLKFLLNSSALEISGPFTETEKNKIINLKRIFIDHQEYLVSVVQCTETNQDNFNIKLNLYSITF